MTDRLGINIDRMVRILLGTLGGYGLAAGYIGMIGALLFRLGMHRAEAVTLAFVTGLLLYVSIIIWVAATTTLLRTGFIIIAASGLTIAVAPLIAKGIMP